MALEISSKVCRSVKVSGESAAVPIFGGANYNSKSSSQNSLRYDRSEPDQNANSESDFFRFVMLEVLLVERGNMNSARRLH